MRNFVGSPVPMASNTAPLFSRSVSMLRCGSRPAPTTTPRRSCTSSCPAFRMPNSIDAGSHAKTSGEMSVRPATGCIDRFSAREPPYDRETKA